MDPNTSIDTLDAASVSDVGPAYVELDVASAFSLLRGGSGVEALVMVGACDGLAPRMGRRERLWRLHELWPLVAPAKATRGVIPCPPRHLYFGSAGSPEKARPDGAFLQVPRGDIVSNGAGGRSWRRSSWSWRGRCCWRRGRKF